MKKLIILSFTIMLLTITTILSGCSNNDNINKDIPQDNSDKLTIYYFYELGCPSCDMQDEFLTEIQQKYENIEIKKYDVDKNNNQQLLNNLLDAYQDRSNAVPITFISNQAIIGFGTKDTTGKIMERIIIDCEQTNCKNPAQILQEQQK